MVLACLYISLGSTGLFFVFLIDRQHLELAKCCKASLKLEPRHVRFPPRRQQAELSRGCPEQGLPLSRTVLSCSRSFPLFPVLFHPSPVLSSATRWPLEPSEFAICHAKASSGHPTSPAALGKRPLIWKGWVRCSVWLCCPALRVLHTC